MSPLWDKAKEAAASARLLLDRGGYDGAADRAFFAMFNAGRTLLASRELNGEGIRNHAKVRLLLQRYFVEPGLMEPDLVKAMKHADRVRWNADFRPEGVKPEVAHEQLDTMDRFMRRAAALLDSKGSGR